MLSTMVISIFNHSAESLNNLGCIPPAAAPAAAGAHAPWCMLYRLNLIQHVLLQKFCVLYEGSKTIS